MRFSEINLSKIGQEVQLVGGIWAGDGKAYLCYFPEFGQEFAPEPVEMDQDDWKALLRQSDLVETEVLARSENGELVKAIVRKCQRVVEQGVSWAVFKRAQYKCEYCGRDNVPLTVDHLVLYEDAGASVEENLKAVCRKCNKVRGRMQYADWLRHPYYLDVSKRLSQEQRDKNESVVATLDAIPRVAHVRSR
jgi:5-methylcytosine-specific restriction endonuclease McrA